MKYSLKNLNQPLDYDRNNFGARPAQASAKEIYLVWKSRSPFYVFGFASAKLARLQLRS